MLNSNLEGQAMNYTSEDIEIWDENGCSPLFHTVSNRNYKFVDWLIEHGAQVNKVCNKSTMNTPLHIAFSLGDIFMVMRLVKAGASLNTLNKKFHTPLAYDSAGICKKLNLLQGTVTQKRSIKNVFQLKRKKRTVKVKTNNDKLLKQKISDFVNYNDKIVSY